MSVSKEDIEALAELEQRVSDASLMSAVSRAVGRIVRRTTAAQASRVRAVDGDEFMSVLVDFDPSELQQWAADVTAALRRGDEATVWQMCEEE